MKERTEAYKKMLQAEKRAHTYFRHGEIDKIVTLYFEITANMRDYEGMKPFIRQKIIQIGMMHEQKKEISKTLMQTLFADLSKEMDTEKTKYASDISFEKRKKGGQKGNQNARKTGLYSALDRPKETDLYKNTLHNIQKDYQHLTKFVDQSTMEDYALLRVEQERISFHKVYYLDKYRTEQLANPNILLLATGGRAPELKEDCVPLFVEYREASPEERAAAAQHYWKRMQTFKEQLENAIDLEIDLHAEGAYRKKSWEERQEFFVRQNNAEAHLKKIRKEMDRCESFYYALLYLEDVYAYIDAIPDADTKYWKNLQTQEIRIQRGIEMKIRLLAQSERQIRVLLKAVYSFSALLEKKVENPLSEAEKMNLYEKIRDFMQTSLPPCASKAA